MMYEIESVDYNRWLDQVRAYRDEFIARICEEFDKVCGVNCFAPYSIFDMERFKRLFEKKPKSWKDAFMKFCKAVENWKEFYNDDYKDNEVDVDG